MARNRSFERTYTIKIKGITTNDFTTNMFDDVIRSVMKSFSHQYKQFDYTIDSSTDKDNSKGEK